MKLGYLLLISFGVVIFLIAIVGWIAVSYSTQVSESLGVSSSVPRLLLTAEIIIVALGFVVGYFTSRKISTPLNSLSSKIDEISKGNFDVDIKEERTADVQEIKSLAESLNRVMITMKLAVSQNKKGKKG